MLEREPQHNHQERAPQATRAPSFSEQLLAPTLSNSDIPFNIRADAAFCEQIAKRKKTLEAYEEVSNDFNNPKHVSSLYSELTLSLQDNEHFTRAALYIPFSLLPNHKEGGSSESSAFVDAYKHAFKKLLTHVDYRADFVDGDVLEPALRNGKKPDQIVKAPHLLPQLMQKGIFSQDEVVALATEADEPALVEAFSDVLPILYRDGHINDEGLQMITSLPQEAFKKLHSLQKPSLTNAPESAPPSQTPKEILDSFLHSYKATQNRISNDTISDGRKVWQSEIQTRRLQEDFAHKLIPHVTSDLTTDTIDGIVAQNTPPVIALILTTLRIKAGIEFETDGAISDHTSALITHILQATSTNKNKEVVQSYEIVQSYLRHFGLSDAGHEKPQFLEKKETPRTVNYFEALTSCATFIENDPLLKECLYPVVISLGSHAKGYAKEGSDIDMGVFVRPGTTEERRKDIQESLEVMNSQTGTHGSCIEFWIEKENEKVTIKNYENPDYRRGDATLTHPITGQWVGNIEATKILRKQLMEMYLSSAGGIIDHKDARTVWLRDIEHNMLQYRLMHKGYSSHLPPTTHKKRHDFVIDGDSMFYDEGYRKVAFELFLKKVFLPVYHSESQ